MTTTALREKATGLICPTCSGVVPVVEGMRIVQCPFCQTHSLVQGDRGVQRWQIRRRVDRAEAEAALRDFLTGARKARDLRQQAEVREVMLAYLPFWSVDATVAGWMFGRVKSGKDDTKPAEFSVFERMNWTDAALDVGDLRIHRVAVSRNDLEPYDSQQLHAEAMVFDPTESATEALDEAQTVFEYEVVKDANQTTTYYQNIRTLSPMLVLAFYPVWIVRYAYRSRTYQVVVDGVSGAIVAGKAPGNPLYRAVTLVTALAAGTFLFINGPLVLLSTGITDDDGFSFILVPVVVGLLLILWGYRNFRYGEEVEDRNKAYQKSGPSSQKGLFSAVLGEEAWNQMRSGSLDAIEDVMEGQLNKMQSDGSVSLGDALSNLLDEQPDRKQSK